MTKGQNPLFFNSNVVTIQLTFLTFFWLLCGCNDITGINDIEFDETDSATATTVDSNSSTTADTDTDTDTDTNTNTNTNTDSSDTNTGSSSTPCQGGTEASRVCNNDGNVEILDQCGDHYGFIQCAATNSTCTDGFCGCIPGTTGHMCQEPCNPSNNNVEICDLSDNDCNGMIDDIIGADDAQNCGGCGNNCLKRPHLWPDYQDQLPANMKAAVCVEGVCQIAECNPGWTGADCKTCVVYVKTGLENYIGNTGRSWDSAAETVRNGLGIAEASGCEVWVAAGTYLPSHPTDSTDVRTSTFQLITGIAIYGGFAGNETKRSERNITANPTILNGDIGIANDTSDNAYHVVTGANDATIDGFTITNGNADGTEPHDDGGGMINYKMSPTISNCTFIQNNALQLGGGISNSGASPTVSNCIFTLNTAAIGGGIGNYSAQTIVNNSSFTQNSATHSGGGINNAHKTATITNCSFKENTAGTAGGGGISNGYASPNITNCIFTLNSTTGDGGGIINAFSAPIVSNCTFTLNSATNGGGVDVGSSSDPIVTNCIIWNNSAITEGSEIYTVSHIGIEAHPIVTYSNVKGGHDGVGNIDMDPIFKNVYEDDFSLSSTSPCIDRGAAIALPADTIDLDNDDDFGENIPFDLDGNPREAGTSVDMGAYEYQP